MEISVHQCAEVIVDVVQIIPPEVLKVTPLEQHVERIVSVVGIILSQIVKEVREVMQITLPEVFEVFGETFFLGLSLFEECVAKLNG